MNNHLLPSLWRRGQQPAAPRNGHCGSPVHRTRAVTSRRPQLLAGEPEISILIDKAAGSCGDTVCTVDTAMALQNASLIGRPKIGSRGEPMWAAAPHTPLREAA